MRIQFHGARGSHALCTIPHRVQQIVRNVWEFGQKQGIKDWASLERALSEKPRSFYQIYGGNTTCIELKSDLAPMPTFFDAGTGITAAGIDPFSSLAHPDYTVGKGKVAIFFSHTHWDHILGLLTLEQLYKGNEFHFYSVHKNLSQRIANLFIEEHFPVPYRMVEPHIKYSQIALGEQIKFGGLKIDHIPQSHPGGSFAYRVSDGIKSFVFATDTELKNVDPPHMTPGKNLYTNADVLILDAQFSAEDYQSREGFGHADLFTAVDFAVRESAKRLYLFHQSPYYDDQQVDEQLLRAREYLKKKFGAQNPLKIEMTVEGDEIEV